MHEFLVTIWEKSRGHPVFMVTAFSERRIEILLRYLDDFAAQPTITVVEVCAWNVEKWWHFRQLKPNIPPMCLHTLPGSLLSQSFPSRQKAPKTTWVWHNKPLWVVVHPNLAGWAGKTVPNLPYEQATGTSSQFRLLKMVDQGRWRKTKNGGYHFIWR